MVNQLPEHIDPIKFAKTGESLSGQIDVAQLQRLILSLDDDSGIVKFDLNFNKIDRSSVATGKFEAEVHMICQRCLNQVKVLIEENIQLEFVVGEDVEGYLEEQGYEVVTVLEESLSLSGLLEDEVMLALPFSPLHGEGKCPDNAIIEKLQETEKPNPFAVLAKLKKD